MYAGHTLHLTCNRRQARACSRTDCRNFTVTMSSLVWARTSLWLFVFGLVDVRIANHRALSRHACCPYKWGSSLVWHGLVTPVRVMAPIPAIHSIK